MHDLPPVIAAGIASGSVYALLALGLVVIFRSTDTVNFALGDIATLAIYVAMLVLPSGASSAKILALSIGVSGLLGVATEKLVIRPLGTAHQGVFVSLVMTIGLGLLIQAVIGSVWGHRPVVVAPIVQGTALMFGVALTWTRILSTVIALVAIAAVAWFFRFTTFGIAMRASAEDQFAARLVGIRPARVAAIGWFVGCGLAAVAAFILAVSSSLNAHLTLAALFRAFAGTFLGGLTSMPGAALGGFAIGVLDNVAGRYLSADYRDTVVFAVIVAVLFIRPSGFLGAGRAERV